MFSPSYPLSPIRRVSRQADDRCVPSDHGSENGQFGRFRRCASRTIGRTH